MNREVLISIINRGRIRFIPVRRCFLCNEYVGYKFVRMCDGSMIPVFSSGCRCCGINNGTLSERTWDEVLDLVKTVQNKPMNERTEEDEFILNSLMYMKWVIIKGVRYPISVVSAFAAYYGDNPFLKIRIRNKYHIIYFDNMDYLNIQIRYLINNYPDFVQIGNWYISKKQVMSWAPKGQAVDGSGWVISFHLSLGLESGTQIKFDREEEYQRALDCLNEKFNVIL